VGLGEVVNFGSNFEISIGEIKDENEGYITHSTFPFREGETVKLNEL
jgi:hypothetical protein